jgi:DNA-binding transcriptional ArsR family regulator
LAKRGPDLIDPRLVKALEHPTRIEILNILWAGPSSPTRIQRQLKNVSLNLVAHHMKVLKELGCVELVETVSRRGAKERIYRTAGPFVITDEMWDELAPKVRQPITASILRMISDGLARTLGAGRFDEIQDNHLSGTQLKLDREGWAEIVKILARTLDEILVVGDRSQERIEASDEAPIPTMIAIVQFPSVESDAGR